MKKLLKSKVCRFCELYIRPTNVLKSQKFLLLTVAILAKFCL